MFKTFAIATLAATAIARGTGDGSSQENAAEVVLIDDTQAGTGAKLTLFTYNASADGVNEFHGDLNLQLTSAATANAQPYFLEWQQFGFCMKFQGEDKWDCMKVNTTLDVTDLKETQFTIVDAFWNGAAPFDQTPTDDPNWAVDNDAGKNWRGIASKSDKVCEAAAGVSTLKTVTCSSINAHWFRNFETSQTEDITLTTSDPTTEYSVFGYRTQYKYGTFEDDEKLGVTQMGPKNAAGTLEPAKITPVYQGFLDAQAAANNSNSDGATALTTYAAAIVAAVYALAF